MTHPAAGARTRARPTRGADALLAGLTPEQAEAVRHGPGPLLIVAGPGTGKTRTLTHRVAHLLATGRARAVARSSPSPSACAPPASCGCGSPTCSANSPPAACSPPPFTPSARGCCASTPRVFGRTDAYTIYDQADLRRVIEWLLADHRRARDPAGARAPAGSPPAAELETRDRAGQEPAARPRRLRARRPATRRPRWSPRSGARVDERARALQRVRLRRPARVRGAAAAPSTRTGSRTCAARWRWLVVDEMQDTNEAQAALVHLLAGRDGNVTVRRRRRPGDLPLPLRRAAQHPAPSASATRATRAIVLGAQLPLARRDPQRRRAPASPTTAQRHPKALIAMRGAGGRITTRGFATDRDEAGWAAGADRRRARRRHAAGRDPRARPHRLRHRARAGGAGRGRDPAPRARLARPLRARRGPRRARLPRAAGQPAPTRRPSGAPCRRRGAASARPRSRRVVAAARERFDGDLITASANARSSLDGAPRAAGARRARRASAPGSSACAREYRAGRSLGHVVVAARHARRRPRRATTRRAATARRSADERRDGERVLEDLRSLCRAAQAYADQHRRRRDSLHRLPRARRRPARRGDPARRGPPHHRLDHPPRQGHRGAARPAARLRGAAAAVLALAASADPEDLDEERRLFYVAATRAKDQLVLTRAHVRGGRATGGPSRFLAEAGLDTPPARARRLTHPSTSTRRPPMSDPDTAAAAPARRPRAPTSEAIELLPPPVRARRDRLSRHEQGRPATATRRAAPRSPPTSAPSRSCSA